MLLSIAIPTYNRNAILRRNVTALLPQLTQDCELIIVDNSSDIPIESTLNDFIRERSNPSLRIVRNRFNVGAEANVLRCFELCASEWLWILGDDDIPNCDAVARVLDAVKRYTNATYINFATPLLHRPTTTRTHGAFEFVENIDHFGNILCISVSLFRAKRLLPKIRYGYQYAYSMAPQLAMLLVSLREDDECILCSEGLLAELEAAGKRDRWSYVDGGIAIFALAYLPGLGGLRKALVPHLRSLVSLELVLMQLINLRLEGLSYSEAGFLIDEYARVRPGEGFGIRLRVKRLCYRVILFWPKLGRGLLKVAARLLGKNLASHSTPGRGT